MFDQCQIEGIDRDDLAVEVVLISSILTISTDVVVVEVVVIRRIVVGGAVHIFLWVALVVGRADDLREVSDLRTTHQRAGQGSRQNHTSALTRCQTGSRQIATRYKQARNGSVVVVDPVRIVQGQFGREVIHQLDAVGGDASLVGHGNAVTHILARRYLGILSGSQSFDQCQIEGFDHYGRRIVVVLVFALCGISAYVVVREENVVGRIGIGRRVDVLLGVAVVVGGCADLCQVGDDRIGRQRTGQRKANVGHDAVARQQTSVSEGECTGSRSGGSGPVGIVQGQFGGVAVGQFDVVGSDASLVDDDDGEDHFVARFYLVALAIGQTLAQREVEGFYGDAFQIVVVFVAPGAGHIVVVYVGVVVRIVVGGAVHIFLRVAVVVGGSTDLRSVGDDRTGGQRAIDHETNGECEVGARQQTGVA